MQGQAEKSQPSMLVVTMARRRFEMQALLTSAPISKNQSIFSVNRLVNPSTDFGSLVGLQRRVANWTSVGSDLEVRPLS